MKNDEKNSFIDKRIIKTKNSIKNAFMEMAVYEDINKISVSDLAAKALVNRSTFYLHYSGVNAVAKDIEEEITARIESCIDEFDVNEIYLSTCKMFRKLTSRLDEAPLIKQYIISSTNSGYIIARIKEIFAEKTMQALMKRTPNAKSCEYSIAFAAAGVVDCYIKWARSTEKFKPLERVILEVSEITEKIIVGITKKKDN